MKLETILQIIYANKMENVITLAVQINNNIALPHKDGDVVTTEISKNELHAGDMFANNKSYGYIDAKIIAINVYSLDKPYMIMLPNGKQKWIGDNSIKGSGYELTNVVEEAAQEAAIPQ